MSESLVTVASYLYLDDAMTARSALEGAGIDAWLADEHIVAIDWFASYAVHGVKLRVRNIDALRAAEVLDSKCETLEEIGEPDETPPDPNVCPACGSREVIRINRLAVFAATALVAVGISVAVRQTEAAFFAVIAIALIALMWDRQRCAECGTSWK